MGGTTGAWQSWFLTQGPRALPLQSRSPHTTWGCHTVTQRSSVSSALPQTLPTCTQEWKEQFCFSKESGSTFGWYAGWQIIFLAHRAISRTVLPCPFGGPSLQTTYAIVHPQKCRLHLKGCLSQRWTKLWASHETIEFIRQMEVLLTLKQRSSWRWSWRFSAIVLPPEWQQLKMTHPQGLLGGCLTGTQWGEKDQFGPCYPLYLDFSV